MDEEESAWDVVRDRINIDVESGEFTALNKRVLDDKDLLSGTSVALDSDDQQAEAGPSSQKIARKGGSGTGSGRRSKNPSLDNLLGQANLEHARGRTKEAMAYLFEAIKISPYNVQTYKELADIYAELNQMEKSFEFKMLAALLSSKTTAEEWDQLAELAQTFERMELAVACLAKAIRCEPENVVYYEKRIQILDAMGDVDLAMKTRLQAAQSINCKNSQVSFPFIDQLIKSAADYYCTLKDEEKATEALEIFIWRSREFGRQIDFEHLALVGMWLAKGRFEDTAKSILALHQHAIHAVNEDGNAAMTVEFTNVGYVVQFPPKALALHWTVDQSLPTAFISHLIVCFVQMGLPHLVGELIDHLLERPIGMDEENIFLDVGRSLHTTLQFAMATNYIERLKARPEFGENADVWFIHGCLHQALDQIELAKAAYEMVIAIQPGHIDARINLSTILQQLGQGERALETLKDLNLDSCSHIPDERLLVRQAEVLLEQKKKSQYISCLRMLLIPHFYVIHEQGESLITKPSRRKDEKVLHSALKRCASDAIKGSSLEKMVKRLGAQAFSLHRSLDDLSPSELHDYAFKLSEGLFFAGEYEEMLHTVCYAFMHPKISRLSSKTFNNLLFFASIKAKNYSLAFEFLRFHMTFTLPKIVKEKGIVGEQTSPTGIVMKRVYTAMNYILCQHQSVNYHRFIMRQLVKLPDCDTLHIISGNNSLITGAYRHALGEYYSVWVRNKDNPLLAFLIALTFAHISCKKDISSRHMVALRALGFMQQYGSHRNAALSQEVQYNIGRMFHQMGIFANAMKCYERVLYECPAQMVWVEDPETGELKAQLAERYDLRRQAAYNLSLIYESSGNRQMARHILEQFCTV